MISINEYLNLIPLEIKAFFANHHKAQLAMINQFKRIEERPALDDIANNSFGANTVVFYFINDKYSRDEAGAAVCNASFGFTIIAVDKQVGDVFKKRDEIALEFKDRICQWLIEATPVAGVSRASNISTVLRGFFPNATQMSLIEVTFDVQLSQGQNHLYGVEPKLPANVHGHRHASLLGVD